MNISFDTGMIFHLNHSFLKSKLHLLKKPDARSALRVFAIIKISLSQPHLYKNVSCNIIVLCFIYMDKILLPYINNLLFIYKIILIKNEFYTRQIPRLSSVAIPSIILGVVRAMPLS
ncbi:MAG: hypothetical protein Q8S84_00755 [bacterium]|nr:hypothetical protein [bacterium]MDP3380111.1 hypothetical protein [bacterium]